jgi:integrase
VRGRLRFAFYGRVSTEDHQDPLTSRARQRDQAGALVAGNGRIVAEYFDIGQSGSRAGAAGLRWFASARGIPAGSEFLLDYDVIEAFCVAGLAGRACSTRGTYRSALYRLATPVHGEPGQRGTPFAGAKPPPPYSPADRAELAAIAAAQRDPAKRRSALAMVVFGIGAGLRPGELVALRGTDVTRRGRQVAARVTGARQRLVPVTSRSSTAAERPRSSRPRWPTAPGAAARCRCAPCSPRCCAWPLTSDRFF